MEGEFFYLFSKVLDYPLLDYSKSSIQLQTLLGESDFSAAAIQRVFVKEIQGLSLTELEEKYTSTFDIKGVCSLDVGYILFGEDYKRGEFLVQMNKVHARYGHELGSELGDYLPRMINLLGLINEEEEREELTLKILIPAIEKMISSFYTPNIFLSNLKALQSFLHEYFQFSFENQSKDAVC